MDILPPARVIAGKAGDYVAFNPRDYITNPVTLARLNAGITQEELARRMKVSQPYIAKLERQEGVTQKTLMKVRAALKTRR